MTSHPWIAERLEYFDSSGIRKVFDLGATLKDPINLSIGQPDFPVPRAVKDAAIAAINEDKNGYSPTQGIAPLREKLQARIDAQYKHVARQVFVTSGTSGGLVLAILALVNPGDEVIVFDPYFVMYRSLVSLAGGTCVLVDTYPDFRIDPGRVADAITPRTKAILFSSPANPTGAAAGEDEIRAHRRAGRRAQHRPGERRDLPHVLLRRPFVSPAAFNPQTIVIDGFSKSHAMTGWRLGFVHGPGEVIQQMIKLQQYTFVCAPQPAQWAGITALDTDMSTSWPTIVRSATGSSRG